MNTLENTVIKNNYCIGCGACTAIQGSKYKMEFDKYGKYKAIKDGKISDDIEMKLANVCPFTSKSNETDIAINVFGENSKNKNVHIGLYQNIYAAYVKDDEYRLSSSSGGMVSFVLESLMQSKAIDGVIHVKPCSTEDTIYSYSISNSKEELRKGKKSKYYPITLDQVLEKISGDGKSYALVAIPCFIKSIRLLQKEQAGFNNIKFFIGIICGQLKSKYFGNIFSLPSQIHHKSINSIDFRVKLPETDASQYAVGIKYFKHEKLVSYTSRPAKDIFSSDWGMGTLKYKACDACDDVFNETADIVFGDAWVTPYREDWKGTNLIITRSTYFENLLAKYSKANIFLKKLSEKEALHTQGASIRHRRDSLSYRLNQYSQKDTWTPTKRVGMSISSISKRQKAIQKTRMSIAKKSHKYMKIALQFNSFILYFLLMQPLLLKYNYLYKGAKGLIPKGIKGIIKKLLPINLKKRIVK
jgi:coenzyme F420-reducing hydrogenase beta subunit